VWDSSRLDVWSTMSFGHVLVIRGRVTMIAEEFIIFNVYAPCDTVAKRELWEWLAPIINNNSDICLCLCGDFNSVRNLEEHKGRSSVFRQVDADIFNQFIADCFLIFYLFAADYLLGIEVMVFL